MRITAEIPFGSLVADNKVPHSAGRPTIHLRLYVCTHVFYLHTLDCVDTSMCPVFYPREPWAGTIGGAYPMALSPCNQVHVLPGPPDPLRCHLLSPISQPSVTDTYVLVRVRELSGRHVDMIAPILASKIFRNIRSIRVSVQQPLTRDAKNFK